MTELMEIVHFTTSSSPLSMAMARSLTAIYRRYSIFPRFLIYYSNIWVPSKIIGLQGVDFIDLFHWSGLATRVFKTMVEKKIMLEFVLLKNFRKIKLGQNLSFWFQWGPFLVGVLLEGSLL